MGMNAMLTSTAQLTSGEQVGEWPVLLSANCTRRSSCSGGDGMTSSWSDLIGFCYGYWVTDLIPGIDHVRNERKEKENY